MTLESDRFGPCGLMIEEIRSMPTAAKTGEEVGELHELAGGLLPVGPSATPN